MTISGKEVQRPLHHREDHSAKDCCIYVIFSLLKTTIHSSHISPKDRALLTLCV